MDARALDTAIQEDRGAGLLPAAVVACIGGTSIGACDDVAAVASGGNPADPSSAHIE
jgi:aromatic-L-amino-acid decarboxylase